MHCSFLFCPQPPPTSPMQQTRRRGASGFEKGGVGRILLFGHLAASYKWDFVSVLLPSYLCESLWMLSGILVSIVPPTYRGCNNGTSRRRKWTSLEGKGGGNFGMMPPCTQLLLPKEWRDMMDWLPSSVPLPLLQRGYRQEFKYGKVATMVL